MRARSITPVTRRLVLLATPLAGLLCGVGSKRAAAALIGDARTPFRAERTVTLKGKSYVGQMWAAPGRQRHFQIINGIRVLLILSAEARMAWLILPDLHLYTALPLQPIWLGYADTRNLGQPVDTAVIEGSEAARYRIHRHEADGSSFDGAAWIDDVGTLIRFDGVYTAPQGHTTPLSMSLAHIARGHQDPGLFALPPGLSQLPAEAIQPLLGLRG